MPPLPSKPQSVIIERWLPYEPPKRKVIYMTSSRVDPNQPNRITTNNQQPTVLKPKNIIVQWESPDVQVKT